MTTQAPDRRALGLPRAGQRRRGGLLMIAGVLLVSAAAYLAGGARSGNDTPAPVATEAETAPNDTAGGSGGADGSGNAGPTGGAGGGGATPDVAAARETAIAIPPGHEGVAVTLPFAPAGGGYVGSGTRVNVFAVEGSTPGSGELVLGEVVVLDSSVEVAPRAQTGTPERPSTAHITYLLAVPRDDAARVVSATQTKTLYITLLPGGSSR